MGKSVASLLAAIIVLFFLSFIRSNASDHRFKRGDFVPLYVNKVRALHNDSETYRYYDLPFCSPVEVEENVETFGEVLNGDQLVAAPYKIYFLIDREPEVICTKRLKREAVDKFRTAVLKDYYLQIYLDQLPIWVSVGRYDSKAKDDPTGPTILLFRHLKFEILYNEDRIIDIVVQNDPNTSVDLTEAKEIDIDFSYSVIWIETNTPFEKRLGKYSQTSLWKHYLDHWFGIFISCFNIFVTITLLTTTLKHMYKNDSVRFTDNEEANNGQENNCWKYIRGDVFRYPRYKSLFTAALGAGTQILVLAIFIYILALDGLFYPYNRGTLITALIPIHALTSGIAGYSAVSYYNMIEGDNWVQTLILTGILFSGPLILAFCFLNTVSLAYNCTAALPFGTIDVIFLTLVASPFLILGGIAGKNSRSEFQAPYPTSRYPREIPQLPWYRRALAHVALAGYVPFSAIYVELDYIFASVLSHQVHTVYIDLRFVFIILLIATAFSAMASTCLQLTVKDHEWWWRSFLYGGSASFFIYGYSFYFYHAKSDMSGFMQTSFFFTYMACICYGLFLMLGAIGFSASLIFVRFMYHWSSLNRRRRIGTNQHLA